MNMGSRNKKKLLMLLGDLFLVPIALWLAFSLRLGEFYVPRLGIPYLFILIPFISVPIFIRFGLYSAIIRYIGFHALWAVTQAVSLYALIWGTVALLSGVEGLLPRSVVVINWFIALILIGGSRMLARWWLSGINPIRRITTLQQSYVGRKNIVIYGAGSSGVQLATALSYSSEYKPVAFIDDDPVLKNHRISGFCVHSFVSLGSLIEKYNVTDVLLAMPSASRSQRNKIVTLLEPYPVHVHTLPGIVDLAQGKVKVDDIREVEIEDLLGRDTVSPDPDLLHANIKEKVVLVTGAGGSIGSELCRQIIQLEPERLILFDHSEFAIYSIEKELEKAVKKNKSSVNKAGFSIVPILGTVCEKNRLERVCDTFGVQTIYHAAAYKHVPMVENNPEEAIRNNIFGTFKAVQAAINTKVESFVLISTDKAVRPTSTMGASKRFAELILQSYGDSPEIETCFSMVRFGNVLDSSGSVIPLFREQIHHGGPVTVTDPKIIRYFMTIHEAAGLVIQAGAMGRGGDVFVLDMGEPVKILDLAKKMIHLSGLEIKDNDHPDGDISIEFTGLRPGEKLYEELLIGDNVSTTKHPLIMKAEEECLSERDIINFLNELDDACNSNDQKMIRSVLMEAIQDYKPQCDIDDHIYKEAIGQKSTNVHVLYDYESRL
jgi:FlaA1/EpsC-like NDP-sugar epimerase